MALPSLMMASALVPTMALPPMMAWNTLVPARAMSSFLFVDGIRSIHRGPSILLGALGQQLLHFPVIHPGADRELEVLLGDRVPVLVHHHDGEQVARGSEEETVEVVRDALADGRAEGVENNLAGDEEEDAEANVSQGPAVLQRARDQEDLHEHVDGQLDGVE